MELTPLEVAEQEAKDLAASRRRYRFGLGALFVAFVTAAIVNHKYEEK